jgi:hypothetical protein
MKRYGFLALLLMMSTLASVAGARGFDGWGERYYLARGPEYSLDEVVSGVRRRNEGRVLSADTVEQSGRQVHRVRVLNDRGRVRGLRFDGDTGQPLPRRQRDESRR